MTGIVTYQLNQISNALIHQMKIHQALEKDVELSIVFNQCFTYWAPDTSRFYEFHNRDAYKPHHTADTVSNSKGNLLQVNVSWSKTGQATYGYEETATYGESLTSDAINLNFGGSFSNSILISSSITETGGGSMTIPTGYRLEVWACRCGNLTRHTDARNDQHGYKYDAIDYTIGSFDIVRNLWLRSNSVPLNVIPNSGD